MNNTQQWLIKVFFKDSVLALYHLGCVSFFFHYTDIFIHSQYAFNTYGRGTVYAEIMGKVTTFVVPIPENVLTL